MTQLNKNNSAVINVERQDKNSSAAHATAAVITGRLRETVQIMYERDGCDAEQIGAALGVPELLVQRVLDEIRAPGPHASELSTPRDELTERARRIENGLAIYESRAVSALGELVDSQESDSVRFAAAREVLRIRSGDYRPKKSEINQGVTIEQINILLQQATSTYEKMVGKPVVQNIQQSHEQSEGTSQRPSENGTEIPTAG